MNFFNQHRGSRQPLQPVDSNNPTTEPSYRNATPTQKNMIKHNTQNSDLKQNQFNYNVQFKVGQKQQDTSRINENQQQIFMSPLPQRKEQQQQQQQQQQILQQQQQPQFKSPIQRNLSQANIMQSPFQCKYRGVSQNNISYTTTSTIQKELLQFKEQNVKQQQKVQQLEYEISRRNSTNFIKELEQKIKMLGQLNEKLKTDNSSLMKLLDVEQVRIQLQETFVKRQQFEQEYDSIIQQFEQWDCERLQNEFEELDQNYITNLVSELENKVHFLIEENDKLNQLVIESEKIGDKIQSTQTEIQQQQLELQKQKLEEQSYKFKYENLLQHQQVPKDSNKTQKLCEQISILENQNERLKQLIQEHDYDEEIRDLEDRIQIIALDNKQLEQRLLEC